MTSSVLFVQRINGGAIDFKGIKNFREPAEIRGARKFRRNFVAPVPGELVNGSPTIVPLQLRENRLGLCEKSFKGRPAGEKCY